jgi:hypothetical protein
MQAIFLAHGGSHVAPVSKPNKNPPSAAATAMRTTYPMLVVGAGQQLPACLQWPSMQTFHGRCFAVSAETSPYLVKT